MINYIVITPVRNEQDNLPSTIESMLRQTILPQQWIIVDDGSTDGTAALLRTFSSRYPWITAVHRPDRGYRKSGAGVVEAFYDGYGRVHSDGWSYLVKLDGDLFFESTYFEDCFAEFARDSKLGIGGGTIGNTDQRSRAVERGPMFHVRGATKIYRKSCWDDIGGLITAPGWDTFDEIKANRHGWATRSFPNIHLFHRRPTGAADGTWRTSVKYGRANYVCGYHPLFMLGKCASRLTRTGAIEAAGIMYGYISGYAKRIPQVNDRGTVHYLRTQQLRRMLGKPTMWR